MYMAYLSFESRFNKSIPWPLSNGQKGLKVIETEEVPLRHAPDRSLNARRSLRRTAPHH
jgi:hypothetical protein